MVASITESLADRHAITDSGESVILYNDGSWKYDSSKMDRSNKSTNPLFRGTKWGQSKKQVKQIEKSKILKDTSSALIYKLTVGGLDAILGYYFVDNKLFRAAYFFQESHSNDNLYIDDYNTIKSMLKQIYNEPSEDEEDWKNDSYKDDRDKWGFAIYMGQLSYHTKWENSSTVISLYLQKGDQGIQMGIEYFSKEHGEEAVNSLLKDF